MDVLFANLINIYELFNFSSDNSRERFWKFHLPRIKCYQEGITGNSETNKI